MCTHVCTYKFNLHIYICTVSDSISMGVWPECPHFSDTLHRAGWPPKWLDGCNENLSVLLPKGTIQHGFKESPFFGHADTNKYVLFGTKKSGSLVPEIQTFLVVTVVTFGWLKIIGPPSACVVDLRWSWVGNTNRLCPNISQVQQMFPQKMVHTTYSTYMFMCIYIYTYMYIRICIHVYIYISYTKNGTSSMTTYFVLCLNLHVPVPSTTSTTSTWLRFSLPVARWALTHVQRKAKNWGRSLEYSSNKPLTRNAKIHTPWVFQWVSKRLKAWMKHICDLKLRRFHCGFGQNTDFKQTTRTPRYTHNGKKYNPVF